MYDLPALLGPLRTASEPALARAVSVRSVERWVATGRLVRLHPGWVTLPEWVDDWTVRAHAATGYTGGTLSHTSALAVHGLVDRPAVVDVTLPAVHRLRSTRSLRIHRTTRPHAVVPAGGLPSTPLPRSLVDAWGDAHRGQSRRSSVDRARNALFRACRERRLGVPSVAAELAAVPRLPGAAQLRELLGALATGYESPLEMLGVRALRDAGLPPPLLQHVVRLPQGSARLDAAWPEILLAVEFDGAAFHADREAWQRDLRRDAALAALGWLVLRFSYADVTQRPAFCGGQAAAAYRARCHGVPLAATPVSGMAARRAR